MRTWFTGTAALDAKAGELAGHEAAAAFRTRQIAVLEAGGQLHDQAWFDGHDGHLAALKAAKAAGRTVNALLLGDDVFDLFDEHTADQIYNDTDQYDDFLDQSFDYAGGSAGAAVVNASIQRDTMGDIAWRVGQILALTADERPDIQYVILNAGANDLAKAGSTQEKAAGAATSSVIATKVRNLASEIRNTISAKVGVLTPVYRGDLNDQDQEYLRNYIKGAPYAPIDYIKDSRDYISSADTGFNGFYKNDKDLNADGYEGFNYLMQELMTNMSPP
jgi:lysophospholipase L1-like esterase